MALKNLLFTRQAPSAARPEEIAAAEAKLGVRFPPGFVEFCTRWNGGFPTGDHEFYAVPASFGEFHQEYENSPGVLMAVLHGISENFPQASLLKGCLMEVRTNFGIVAVASDMFGNQVVFRADSPLGPVYWRDKDLWEIPKNPAPGPQIAEKPRLIPIANDLEAFYNGLTKQPG